MSVGRKKERTRAQLCFKKHGYWLPEFTLDNRSMTPSDLHDLSLLNTDNPMCDGHGNFLPKFGQTK